MIDSDQKKDESLCEMKVEEHSLNPKMKIFFFSCFFFLGIINNLGYVLIQTGSSSLSEKFGHPSLLALYQLALIVCSSLTRVFNSRYLIKISYRKRITFLGFYFLAAYLLLFLTLKLNSDGMVDNTLGFVLTMIPSFIMGTGSALGEATIIASLRNYPKNLINGWSSGTGLAGIFGALLSLIFAIEKIQTQNLYLFVSPLSLLYLFIFILQENHYNNFIKNKNLQNYSSDTDSQKLSDQMESGRNDDPSNNDEGAVAVENSTEQNYKLNCSNFKLAFKYSKFFIINLGLVYFLEYTILNGFSNQVHKRGYIPGETISKDLQFILFCLFYQIGVFISRSSLFLIKDLDRVDVLTYVQLFNYVIWFLQVYFNIFQNYIVMFLLMILVGLMGGSSYVLCFYKLLNNQSTPLKMKELSVNIATMMNDTGIFLSSICVLFYDNTIMKYE